jgi:hypothetical protein
VCLALVPACNREAPAPPTPSTPGLVLELAFENACEPVAAAELTMKAPPSGIGFDTGVEGRAARFDGSGAELKLRGLDRFAIADAMTLELFVNAENWKNPYAAGSGLESLVSHTSNFTVAIDPHSWSLKARLTTGESTESLQLRGGTIRPGTWHHVALVMDGAAGKARLVLDGETVEEIEARGNVVVQSNLDLVVGTWFGKNQAFCGRLDSIRLWKKALSDDELRARAAIVARVASPQ